MPLERNTTLVEAEAVPEQQVAMALQPPFRHRRATEVTGYKAQYQERTRITQAVALQVVGELVVSLRRQQFTLVHLAD